MKEISALILLIMIGIGAVAQSHTYDDIYSGFTDGAGNVVGDIRKITTMKITVSFDGVNRFEIKVNDNTFTFFSPGDQMDDGYVLYEVTEKNGILPRITDGRNYAVMAYMSILDAALGEGAFFNIVSWKGEEILGGTVYRTFDLSTETD